jgi:uroporphyrinogen decarboxylase
VKRRERILTTLRHQEPDRVPVNLDQTSDQVQRRILAYYGVDDMHALYRKTGIDAFSVWHEHAAVVPIYRGWRGEDPSSTYLPWGKVRQYVDPLAEETLESYRWPQVEEFDFTTLKERLMLVKANDMTTASGHAGVGFQHHVELRGHEQCLYDLSDPGWMDAYLARNRAFFVPYFEALFGAAQGEVDILRADEDMGGMQRMMISPQMWRRYYKPLWAQVFEIAHRHGARVWMHSCGYHRAVVGDFIEIGVDILNPVPPYVSGSDPLEMKTTYGDRLVLDGTVDHINVLIAGNPRQVEQEVRRRIDQCATGGGFILGASQGFTEDVPMQNIAAMYEAALKYGAYR